MIQYGAVRLKISPRTSRRCRVDDGVFAFARMSGVVVVAVRVVGGRFGGIGSNGNVAGRFCGMGVAPLWLRKGQLLDFGRFTTT